MTRTAAGLLLTGGAARRLGTPKADLERDGVRLGDHLATRLAAVAAPVLEVGAGATALPAVREAELGSGPLAALGAGLTALAERGVTGHALALAVDLPDVPEALLGLVRDVPGESVVVPCVDGHLQPLCARYPIAAAPLVDALVHRGHRRLLDLFDLLDAVEVVRLDETAWGGVADATAFADLDVPADLERTGWRPADPR